MHTLYLPICHTKCIHFICPYVTLSQPCFSLGLVSLIYTVCWQLFDSALAIEPKDFLLQYNRGRVLFEMDRIEEAAQAFESVTCSQPEDTAAWYRLGTCLKRMGREEVIAITTAHHKHVRVCM